MSDVLRSYSGVSLSRRRRRKRVSRWRWMLLIVVLATLSALWMTRDSHPIGELLPADQRYHVYIDDPLETRLGLAQSRIWALAPEGSVWAAAPERLLRGPGIPEWVLNNVFNGPCHVSGRDLKNFSDPLLLTRMSRIGCLVEKLHWLVPGVDADYAGGLRLRRIPGAGVYYAVRGRTIAVSASRAALIRALTLSPDEQTGLEELTRGMADMTANDLACRVDLEEDDPLGETFESLRLGVRIAPSGLRLQCRTALRPVLRERLAGLLNDVVPRELKNPPDGLMVAAMDLGKPLPMVLAALDDILGGGWGMEGLAENMESGQDAPDPIRLFLATLLWSAGTEVRIIWHGMDHHEMMPVPELAFFSDTDPERALEHFTRISPPPPNTPPWEMVPRFDSESGILWLPMFGGPSLQPMAGLRGSELVVSSSRPLGELLLAQAPENERVPQPGNLYVKLRPYPCAREITEAAAQFAAFGLIRGHNEISFRQAAETWLESARRVADIALLAAYENGEIRMDMRVTMDGE